MLHDIECVRGRKTGSKRAHRLSIRQASFSLALWALTPLSIYHTVRVKHVFPVYLRTLSTLLTEIEE